jgi:hypothetical protein
VLLLAAAFALFVIEVSEWENIVKTVFYVNYELEKCSCRPRERGHPMVPVW